MAENISQASAAGTDVSLNVEDNKFIMNVKGSGNVQIGAAYFPLSLLPFPTKDSSGFKESFPSGDKSKENLEQMLQEVLAASLRKSIHDAVGATTAEAGQKKDEEEREHKILIFTAATEFVDTISDTITAAQTASAAREGEPKMPQELRNWVTERPEEVPMFSFEYDVGQTWFPFQSPRLQHSWTARTETRQSDENQPRGWKEMKLWGNLRQHLEKEHERKMLTAATAAGAAEIGERIRKQQEIESQLEEELKRQVKKKPKEQDWCKVLELLLLVILFVLMN